MSLVLRSSACLRFSFSFGTDENDEITPGVFHVEILEAGFFLFGGVFKYFIWEAEYFFACTHAGCFKMHLEAYLFLVTFLFSPYHLPIDVYLRVCVFLRFDGMMKFSLSKLIPRIYICSTKTPLFYLSWSTRTIPVQPERSVWMNEQLNMFLHPP